MHLKEASEHFREEEILSLVEDVRLRLKDYKFKLAPRQDFEFIAKFVRVKKYKPAKAADAIYRYYGHIYRYMGKTKGARPSDCVAAIESQTLNVFKNKFDGTKIVYTKLKNWDSTKCTMRELFNSSIMIMEEVLLDETIQSNGAIAIIDLDGLGFRHVREFLPDARYTIQLMLNGFPASVAAIHIMNPPTIYWTLHKLFMKLVPEKHKHKGHFHSSYASLHEHIDRNCLPKSLGGTLEEQDTFDIELIQGLMKKDTCYDDIWSSEDLSIQ